MNANNPLVPAQEVRILHVLMLSALLQTSVTLCGLWTVGLLLVSGRSQTLQDLITVCSTVATALLKIGLHLLGI